MLIKKVKWWLGYTLIRLGWRICMSAYNIIKGSSCSGISIKENDTEYSIDFVGNRKGD